ncbi:MAG: DUF2304 domain-containing protein [Planctomycetota bacterium]
MTSSQLTLAGSLPTAFQVILLTVLAGLALATVAMYRARILDLVSTLVVLCGLAAGAVFTILPDSTSVIANALGIRRGADLLLYCGLIGGVVGFMLVYAKVRRLRSEITSLVRELALLNQEQARTRASRSDRDEQG